MKKSFFVALVCLAATTFVACVPGSNDNPNKGKSPEGQWVTSPDQLKDIKVNDTINDCYQIDVWCDGTTIGREYMWATESAIVYSIKAMQAGEIKAYGAYKKKYKYTKVTEPTQAACTSRQWEGAECWLETITYKNANGEKVTNQEYLWMPAQNIKERHDYYMEKLESIGVFDHKYEKANINDKDACIMKNPNDDNAGDLLTKHCWALTMTVQGVTNTIYVWNIEQALKNQVAAYQSQGIPASYKLADANDENACNAKMQGL